MQFLYFLTLLNAKAKFWAWQVPPQSTKPSARKYSAFPSWPCFNSAIFINRFIKWLFSARFISIFTSVLQPAYFSVRAICCISFAGINGLLLMHHTFAEERRSKFQHYLAPFQFPPKPGQQFACIPHTHFSKTKAATGNLYSLFINSA